MTLMDPKPWPGLEPYQAYVPDFAREGAASRARNTKEGAPVVGATAQAGRTAAGAQREAVVRPRPAGAPPARRRGSFLDLLAEAWLR